MKKLSLILTALIAVGCAKKELATQQADTQVDPDEAAVESSLATIGALADEQIGESYARWQAQPTPIEVVQRLILPQAHAESLCQRAIYASCNSGVRRADYSSCAITLRSNLEGYVQLQYSQASCSLSGIGDSVTRTYDLQLSGPRGGVARVSSATAADYRNQSYGGGGTLARTASGHSVQVNGKHLELSFRGRPLYNVSVRTLANLGLSGGLSRSGRTLDGGQLEVNHNLAGFTAVYEPHNVQWSGSCCYPSSGSIDVTYSGARTGSATLTFLSCGLAQLVNGTETKTIQMNYCE